MVEKDSNGRRWPDRSIMLAILAAVAGDGYISWSSGDQLAALIERGIRTEEQIIGHLIGHPDAALTTRMNLLQMDHNSLERRVTNIEIRLGPDRE